MPVVLNARVTAPGHFLYFKSHMQQDGEAFVRVDEAAVFSNRADAVRVAVGTEAGGQSSRTTISCRRFTCGSMGSGLIPGKSGFNSLRISTTFTPRLLRMPDTTPRPAPYMQSMPILNPALAMASRSANFEIASM